MKLNDYLNDKLYLIITSVLVLVSTLLFFYFLGFSKSLLIMIAICVSFVPILVLVVEYYRRKNYYNNIYLMLDEIEDKHLLFDLIERREFLDAQVLEDVIRIGNHSMNNKVDEYKTNQEEYKRYIELWVHEIKTPIAALKLMMGNKNDKNALDEIENVNYYIEQALYYARSTAVYKDYIIEPVQLKDVVYTTIKQLSNNFIKNDLSVEVNIDDCLVYSDSKWLNFIIKQILINSIQYSNRSGKITINAKSGPQHVSLEIIDNGVGISAEDLPRIFEVGFTGSSGRQYNQATGMGLYLVKKLSDSLNIDINARSNEATIFTLSIPRSDLHFK